MPKPLRRGPAFLPPNKIGCDILPGGIPLARLFGKKSSEPLWKGPEVTGITFSLLCKFLECRHRFWLRTICGLRPKEGWKYAMYYGSMFHECEEAYEAGRCWMTALEKYGQKTKLEFPESQKDIHKWQTLCALQFPIYVAHWKNDQNTRGIKSAIQEQKFNHVHRITRVWPQFRLSNMSTGPITSTWNVILKGKIDSAYLQLKEHWLKENKTKGDIDEGGISTTLRTNLQAMLYHVALPKLLPGAKIAGTLYNVIRRPLSERSPIRQRKGEPDWIFYKRVGEKIKENPGGHFYRWPCVIRTEHVATFCNQILNPILIQLCEWWDSIKDDPFDPWKSPLHWINPNGVYYGMANGFRGDFYEFLATGDRTKVETINDLFPELA